MKKILLALAVLLACSSAYAQPYKGDVILGATIRHSYATADNTTGADKERTAAGTPKCYPNGSATEQTTGVSDTGLTEFDGIVGQNQMTVDTSQSGFAVATDYDCWITASTLNAVTVSYPVFSFSIENRYPLKGLIVLHATEDTSQTSTVSQIELTGNVITSDDQYKAYRLWDVTDGWDRAIVGSNAAGDYLTIYPDAPAAPTNLAVLYIMRDVIYPVNFFDPATQQVDVGKMNGTAITAQAGVNFNDVFNNGNASSGSSARVGTVGTNTTNAAADAATIKSAIVLAVGVADSGTLVTMVDAALTQADTNYWGHDVAIVFTSGNIAGEVACVTAFDAAADKITFTPPVSQAVGIQSYVLVPGPGCDPFR